MLVERWPSSVRETPRRPRLGAALRFLAIACALGAAVALLSCSGESAEPSLALKGATLDGDAIPDVQGAEERTEVRRIGFLLGAIAPRCGITQDRLANMAVAAKQELLNTFGRERKARVILEDLNATTQGRSGLDCALLLTTYIFEVGASR